MTRVCSKSLFRILSIAALVPAVLLCAAFARTIGVNASEVVRVTVVEHAWSRATPNAIQPATVYLSIKNMGDRPDKLVRASTAAAKRVELRTEAGVFSRPRTMDYVDIPAGKTVDGKPGAWSIKLYELLAPLQAGAVIPLALDFEEAGRVDLQVEVIERMGPPHRVLHPQS